MTQQARYDWTGERIRRKQRIRRVIGAVMILMICGILLNFGWGYLPQV